MADGISLGELDGFVDRLTASSKGAVKLEKQFLRQQGSKLVRKTRQRARAEVRKTEVNRKKYTRAPGTYHKSIKRGKVYQRDGELHIRAYSYDPVAHLIEDDYTPKLRNGRKGTKQPGKKIFTKELERFDTEFAAAIEELADKMAEEI